MNKIYSKISIVLASALTVFGAGSCDKYLDVVPDDGIATVEMAFNLRAKAIGYLATCYSYMTKEGTTSGDYAMLTGDELWDLVGRVVTNTNARVPQTLFNIARGFQSANAVYGNDWAAMYQGIRCCDVLIENIYNVPDMTKTEMDQWAAEARFLKAYYHFNLVRKYGPVPIIYKSLPIDSDVETVRVYRNTIDECFDFILGQLDEALPYLPLVNPTEDEYGRITQLACAGLRARVAAYAASPLFNGNDEEATLVDNRGTRLFPAKSDAEKLARWTAAMKYCKDAIDLAEKANKRLYDTTDVRKEFRMCDTLATQMALRNAYCERWNSEVMWGNTQCDKTLINMFQRLCQPVLGEYSDMLGGYRFIGVPLKVAEQFYTNHGLPIANDNSWSGVNPFDLRDGDDSHAFYIKKGYTTCNLNFNREPRFYAFLGFDGGTWMGQMANYNDIEAENMPFVECRIGGKHGKSGSENGPVTGYFPKKMIPYRTIWVGNNSFSGYWFAFPMVRLTDLYLLYAECINEAEGPTGAHADDLFYYLDQIRGRAGIPDVKTAWDNFSNRPGYYNSQTGMRDIIHKERLNEMAFESSRFWDLRRWKEAAPEYQKLIYGYNVAAATPDEYYVKTLVAQQTFGLKDYFWPIATPYIEVNPNLVQNLGW